MFEIGQRVMIVKKHGFRGNKVKEQEIKAKISKLLSDDAEVERIFRIIFEQVEY